VAGAAGNGGLVVAARARWRLRCDGLAGEQDSGRGTRVDGGNGWRSTERHRSAVLQAATARAGGRAAVAAEWAHTAAVARAGG
jgi:hypothetical protein